MTTTTSRLSANALLGLSNQFFAATGKIYVSSDGAGSNAGPTTIRVNKKTATSVVRKAFLMAATVSDGPQIADGQIKLNGTDVAWDSVVPSAISSFNHLADVTAIVKPVVDAAPAGLVNLTVDEGDQTASIDGEALAVVFDDPSQTATHSVIMVFGAQDVSGASFAITLGQPIDPSQAGAVADFGLGISFSFQTGGQQQFSIVKINDAPLSNAAGGEDDCHDASSANGCLITVGGIGDSNSNPADPNAPPTNPRSDDELYSLLPFLTPSTSSVTVFTQNPSEDDNIFFAYFDLSTLAVVGEGILLGPDTATNRVGTNHTLTAEVVDATGAPVSGVVVTFTVLSGPNAGKGGQATTGQNGVAVFTYSGTGGAGTDQIQASFQDAEEQTIVSNIVTKTWQLGRSHPVPVMGPFGLLIMFVMLGAAAVALRRRRA